LAGAFVSQYALFDFNWFILLNTPRSNSKREGTLMRMPLNLFVVRHGESEGNQAKRFAHGGDSPYTQEFLNRHSATYRLTKKGRDQAIVAGAWLKRTLQEERIGIGRYITSDYVRACETAGLLGLPDAVWFRDHNITERNWGDLDNVSLEDREQRFADALRRRDHTPFFWTPPNGDSYHAFCLHIDKVLGTLHRECSDTNVVMVCHGEVMLAIRVLLTRMGQEEFTRIHLSDAEEDKIFNCEVHWYTRTDPSTNCSQPHFTHLRRVRPALPAENIPIHDTGFVPIVRPTYSNNDLLRIADQFPNILGV
jgi:broad specificity phosphatase PhoE